jgi:sugar phosphate isomerase/epimerase
MDVFWVVHGGANPVELFAKHPERFPSTHLKDMRKGSPGRWFSTHESSQLSDRGHLSCGTCR